MKRDERVATLAIVAAHFYTDFQRPDPEEQAAGRAANRRWAVVTACNLLHEAEKIIPAAKYTANGHEVQYPTWAEAFAETVLLEAEE